jgi:Ni,Fe-hydrogenase III large subunit
VTVGARGLAPDLREVAPESWTAAARDAQEGGLRFSGLFALARGGGPAVAALFGRAGDNLLLLCEPGPAGAVPSLLPEVPAAAWDEREAHDLHGVGFAGHEPLRPLIGHDPDLSAWTVPVAGADAFQVAVGPIHAGIIESGHFRFHVVGERILHLDLRLFYKHRGLERAAEGALPEEALRHAERACGACAVANGVAFALAWEGAAGLWPDPELARARTLLLELERLYNHLNDIGAVCAGVGFAPGSMAFAAFKERAQRLNERLTGHRFLFGAVGIGSSDVRIAPADADRARSELGRLAGDVQRAWRELQFAHSFQDRLGGVGVVTRENALCLGAVGPVARASGVAEDVRSLSPRLQYDAFRPARPAEPAGDVAARLEMRAVELEATFGLLDGLLAGGIAPAGSAALAGAAGEAAAAGVGRVESPRGETVCVAMADGPRVARLHLRTASFANWPVLAHCVRDNLLPDFPLVNKSFELCYACCDR